MQTDSGKEGISRRRLLQATAPAAVMLPTIVPASALGRGGQTAPSDRINLGIIGVNGMGRGNLKNCAAYKDVVVTAICDVSTERREAALNLHRSTARGHSDPELRRDPMSMDVIASAYWRLMARCRVTGRHLSPNR
ncbi:MAG: hypothetical protein LC114_00690 [Bryobacterales bacterium]|nr:hypothetical protein [Bryobacterales bacterium]